MVITEIAQLDEIKERVEALRFGCELTKVDGVKTDLRVLIVSTFEDTIQKILLDELNHISFVSSVWPTTEELKERCFITGKNQLLELINNVSTTIIHRPKTLKRVALNNANAGDINNANAGDINNANAGDKSKKSRINVVLSVIKDWVIPILGLIVGAIGGYELHVANNINNELKQELKNEIKQELQQDISQMVKQEVQQKVDNQIIINNNK